jgi:hypothetical protein
VADVTRGVNSLYVYYPLVEPRMVGDAQVPLLRIVPVAGRDVEMMTSAFDHIQYCPLVLRRFQTVEIDIRDDTGVKIPFREQYPYFVYAYVVPTVRILYLCQSYLPGSTQI